MIYPAGSIFLLACRTMKNCAKIVAGAPCFCGFVNCTLEKFCWNFITNGSFRTSNFCVEVKVFILQRTTKFSSRDFKCDCFDCLPEKSLEIYLNGLSLGLSHFFIVSNLACQQSPSTHEFEKRPILGIFLHNNDRTRNGC